MTAGTLEQALEPFLDGELPVRLVAWDGSEAGPADAPVVELRSPDALRRLLWHPGELGAAQAYVTGELNVPGDLDELDRALTHAFSVAAERGLSGRRPSVRAVATAVRTALGLDLLGRPPAAPSTQARIRGRLHSKDRDRRSISHHYDTTADFYSLILDQQTMAYSCGYHSSPDQSLEEAQLAKLDLVCRKLGLGPDSRLLDVGCGWGSLSLHAAEHFGARVVGVTISAEQRKFAEAAARRRGVADRVEFQLCDYRDAVPLPGAEYDAVASLEMGEHVGERNYTTYAQVLHDSVRPGGRVLVQQMSRTGRWPGGGPFIESFIAPTCTCVRSARPSLCSRPPASRRAMSTPCASTTCSRSRVGSSASSRTSTRSPRWSARSWSACGGSTSWVARWPSATAGWASTRCSSSVPATTTGCR